MREYELVIVIDGGATAAKKKSILSSVETIIREVKGKVKSTKDWGKLDLAYKIKGSTAGIFTLYLLELTPESVGKINTRLLVVDEVIRFLLVKAQDKPTPKKTKNGKGSK